jgi:histidyl-tRNA synthetase
MTTENKKCSLPRGTADILPQDISKWQTIETAAREVLRVYNYQEIRTPLFEETELFARSMGKTSDVVQKQMLTLQPNQREGEEGQSPKIFSLRPEGTASIVRSYIENSLDRKEGLTKLFYIGAMFRGERPQKGRLRQFHQIGVEAIGPQAASPYLDAEVISLSIQLLKSFGINDYTLKINSLGTPEDKAHLSRTLRDLIAKDKSQLCPTCQERFERNIFRVLDCKSKQCQSLVAQLNLGSSFLCEESQAYYAKVKGSLRALGIKFEEVPTLVR